MALFIVKNMLTTADCIRTTRRYSSAQSLSRAVKNGSYHVMKAGRLRFARAMDSEVAALHGISSWEGLPAVSEMPAGVIAVSRISKTIKLGEVVILAWALLNRMDAYWVGGHFVARFEDALSIAQHEKKRKASHTKPPVVRKKRRYLNH